jgi:hypothetical protein
MGRHRATPPTDVERGLRLGIEQPYESIPPAPLLSPPAVWLMI